MREFIKHLVFFDKYRGFCQVNLMLNFRWEQRNNIHIIQINRAQNNDWFGNSSRSIVLLATLEAVKRQKRRVLFILAFFSPKNSTRCYTSSFFGVISYFNILPQGVLVNFYAQALLEHLASLHFRHLSIGYKCHSDILKVLIHLLWTINSKWGWTTENRLLFSYPEMVAP